MLKFIKLLITATLLTFIILHVNTYANQSSNEFLNTLKEMADSGNKDAAELFNFISELKKSASSMTDTEYKELTRLAESGDLDAQTTLGLIAFEKNNNQDALKWLKIAGDRGRNQALVYLAMMYLEGRGVTQNFLKAHEVLKIFANNNNQRYINTLTNLAHYYSANDNSDCDPKILFTILQPLAEAGDTAAQGEIGAMYFKGTGTAKDYHLAEKWLRKATEDNNPPSFWLLGRHYYEGLSVSSNIDKAAELFKDSARLGDTIGTIYYAKCLLYGKGIQQNKQEAFKLFKQTAEQGNSIAQYMLGKMYYEGSCTNPNFDQAVKWYKLSAQQGDRDGQYLLGYMYHSGKALEQNYSQATKLYELAAKQGHSGAMNNLGVIYEKGQGVKKDYNRAAELYQSAANLGNVRAKYHLGYMYYYGLGVTKNYQEAFKWFDAAAVAGDVKAKKYLIQLEKYKSN